MENIREIWAFIRAVTKHWIALLTGGALAAALGLWGQFKGAITSAHYVAVLCIAIIFASYCAWKEEKQRGIKAEGEAARKAIEVTKLEAIIAAQGRLEISFTKGERRFEESKSKIYYTIKQLSVCVENVGAKGLTQCQLYFDGISTEDGRLATKIALLPSSFSLNPSASEFIPLVSCDEGRESPPGNAALHVPARVDGATGDRIIETSKIHVITLRATAAECEPCVRNFRVWLSDDAKIRMKRLD